MRQETLNKLFEGADRQDTFARGPFFLTLLTSMPFRHYVIWCWYLSSSNPLIKLLDRRNNAFIDRAPFGSDVIAMFAAFFCNASAELLTSGGLGSPDAFAAPAPVGHKFVSGPRQARHSEHTCV